MTLVVIARWKANPIEADQVAEALHQLTAPSRAEPGCLAYEPLRAVEDPTLFMIYEEYADRAALDDHRSTPHFERYALGEAIPRLEERVVTFFNKL